MTRSATRTGLEEAFGNLEVLAGLLDILDEAAAGEMPARTQLAIIGIRKLTEKARDEALAALEVRS